MNDKQSNIRNVVNLLSAIVGGMFLSYFNYSIGKEAIPLAYWLLTFLFVVFLFVGLWFVISKQFRYINIELDNHEMCKYETRPCCGINTFRNVNINYKLNPDPSKIVQQIKKNYSLYLQSEILKNKEKNFANKKGKEIWIVSSNLDSEITDEGATPMAKENVKNGIEYTFFYANNTNEEQIRQNIFSIKKSYQQDDKLFFIPYGDKDGKDELESYLFSLFGIVIYIYEDKNYDAYFSIRKDLDTPPIYYEMPLCMARKYYGILNKLKNSKNEKFNTKSHLFRKVVYMEINNLLYQEIKKEDEGQLKSLIEKTLALLEKPEFFIPYSEWELNNLYNKDYAYLHGAYDGNKLIGMAQIYIAENMLSEEKKILEITDEKVCEFGGNLMLPEYQGKGIMVDLVKMQIDFIKQLGYTYAIAKTHPDNVAANKLFQKLNMNCIGTFTLSNGFLRNIYAINL